MLLDVFLCLRFVVYLVTVQSVSFRDLRTADGINCFVLGRRIQNRAKANLGSKMQTYLHNNIYLLCYCCLNSRAPAD